MDSIRSATQIENTIATLTAEADALDIKSKTEALSEDESKRFDEVLATLESETADHARALKAERLVEVKAKAEAQAVRPAPRTNSIVSVRSNKRNEQEDYCRAMANFILGEGSGDDHYRAKQYGFNLSRTQYKCNFHNRDFTTGLTKGTAAAGLELGYETYSNLVTRFLLGNSPFVANLRVDVTPDGEPRTYYFTDDTDCIASYMDASPGTEKAPNRPEKTIVTDNRKLGVRPYTSGVFPVSWERLRDAPFDVVNQDIIPAIANSKTRFLEKEALTGNGNGLNGCEGILETTVARDPVAEWTIDEFEAALYSIPTVYRKNLMWISNGTTKGAIHSSLKDGIERSYFETNANTSVEYDSLLGVKFFESVWMPDNQVVLVCGDHYTLRLVGTDTFAVYREAYAPHIGYESFGSFGGGWTGPDSTNILLELDDSI